MDQFLKQRVKSAVDTWVDSSAFNLASFLQNWRGLGDGNDNRPCVALVEYCRAIHGEANPFLIGQLARFAEQSGRLVDVAGAAEIYHPKDEGAAGDLVPPAQTQLVNLVNGLVETVRAAVAWTARDQQEGLERLEQAAAAYGRAWPLSKTDVSVPSGENLFRGEAQSVQFLAQLASGYQLSVNTWLILQRLLARMFNEPEATAEFTNRTNLLFFAGNGGGHVQPVTVEVVPATIPTQSLGLLVDPLAFGVTVLDSSMQRSLRRAFRCGRQSAEAEGMLNPQRPRALRLSLELPELAAQLGGGSAGGLLACSLYATAIREPLDTRYSATLGLDLPVDDRHDESLSLRADEVVLTGVKEIVPKLQAAEKLSVGLERVALCEADHAEWRKIYPEETARPKTVGVSSLAALFEVLRGDARFEPVLKKHSTELAGLWGRIAAAPDSADNSEHRLDCYVAPAYRVERPKKHDRHYIAIHDEDLELEDVPGEGDDAIAWLFDRVTPGKGLIVHDKAGAGKTVFSLRLQHVVSQPKSWQAFGDRPPLIIRLEGGWLPMEQRMSVDASLPTILEQIVADGVLARLIPDEGKRRLAAEYALRNARVVFLVDGFDQFSQRERDFLAALLKNRSTAAAPDARLCRWVITTRVHVLAEHREFTDETRWTRARIELFDERRQNEYFETPVPDPRFANWRDVLPEEGDPEEFIGLPMALRLLREKLEERAPTEPVVRYCSLADLFHDATRTLLEREVRQKAPKVLLDQLKTLVPQSDNQIALLQRVIAVLAFQMLLEENYNGRLQGVGDRASENPVLGFRERARTRFLAEHDAKLANSALKASQRKLIEAELAADESKWTAAIEILDAVELNHRMVMDVFQQSVLAFRSRKMVEFYAALHLAKYATAQDLADDGEPCVWDFLGDDQWGACWKLVIEMPNEVHRDPHWGASLDLLFQRPRGEFLRPTELMFRAWRRLSLDRSLLLEGILQRFRQQFLEILNSNKLEGEALERAKRAAELVPDFVLETYVPEPERRVRIAPPSHQAAYVRCPPQGDRLAFWMGTAEEAKHGYDDEKPRHRVSVRAFRMAACTVTRGQYRLFDPNLENVYKTSFERISPDDDCPVIHVVWFDGFCLALWLGDGASLPTETEWEGAARGGRDAPDDVIAISPFDSTFTTGQVNFDGRFPLDGEKSVFPWRTLPVRWNDDRRRTATPDIASVPDYRPNDFEIWQAHGNVLEWCLSEFDIRLHARQGNELQVRVEELVDSAVSAVRVLRGGSWNLSADGCRSARRNRSDPDYRYDGSGLRLCWRSR